VEGTGVRGMGTWVFKYFGNFCEGGIFICLGIEEAFRDGGVV
jgi:hypothetical protein